MDTADEEHYNNTRPKQHAHEGIGHGDPAVSAASVQVPGGQQIVVVEPAANASQASICIPAELHSCLLPASSRVKHACASPLLQGQQGQQRQPSCCTAKSCTWWQLAQQSEVYADRVGYRIDMGCLAVLLVLYTVSAILIFALPSQHGYTDVRFGQQFLKHYV